MKFSDEYKVNDRCIGCPQLVKNAEMYDDTDKHMQAVIEAGIGGTFEETLRRFLDTQDVPVDKIQKFTEDSSPQIRERVTEYIDQLDRAQIVKAMIVRAMQDSCKDGVLKMRATRNGNRVMAWVCMSAMMPEMTKGAGWEAVTIVRSDVAPDPTADD